MRLDLDVRRRWRCADCGAERRASGDRTVVTCHVCGDGKRMSLIEPRRPVRTLAEPLDLVVELHPDDVALPAAPVIEVEPVVEEPMTEVEALESPMELEESPAPQSPPKQRRADRKRNRRRSRKKPNEGDSPASPSSHQRQESPRSAPDEPRPTVPESPPTDGFGDGL
ncbi:MAG: hypothetical protein KDA93_15115 [Planctomycetaceae bacterium]|nr:hypothetical protein [Planctomycetaceae bacterium]